MRRAALKLVVLLFVSLLPGQQAAAPAGQANWPRGFDAVSIKPVEKGQLLHWTGERPESGGRLTAIASPGMLIMFAFGVTQKQIGGLPAWADTNLYSIEAVSPPNAPDLPQQQNTDMERPMVRAMLEQYFRLKIHHAPQPEEVLELVIAKGGPKLKPATSEEIAALDAAKGDATVSKVGMSGGRAFATAGQIHALAGELSFDLQKMVLDKTGLTGYYDFTLTWTPGLGERMPGGPHASGPSLYGAVQSQLGLQLKSARVPVDMIVVDAIERPASGN